MADDTDFPTAIVPYRPGAVAERFDQLARRFGDPLTKLFILAAAGTTEDTQRMAASELLPYRYPRLRASEMNVNAQGAGQVNIQINIGAPPPTEVDPLG
jgi:hypothetical protein